MDSSLLPVSFDSSRAAAVQGWLGRYPQGVEFARLEYATAYLSPVYVDPREPEHLFRSPFGFDSWAEYYQPDAHSMKQAITELAALRPLRGAEFRQAVDSFVRKFGPLANEATYLTDIYGGGMPSPEFIRRTLGDRMMRTQFPLWCYKREARILAETLRLYRAVREGDASAAGDWQTAWIRVLNRVHPYLHFIGFSTDWQEHAGELRATSPDQLIPYVPQQRIVADNLLGAIYLHVLQIVLEQQLVRSCAARGCNRIFVPSRSDQVYCTSSCASSERVRRFREKRRQERGLTNG